MAPGNRMVQSMAAENVSLELREPAAAEQLLPHDVVPPLLIGLGLLVAVVLAGLAIRWFRRRSTTGTQSVREFAFREALAGLAQVAAPTARSAAVQTSLILRTYLSLAAQDPALFETHEEFIARSDSLGRLTDDARAACREGFARLAALKYAPELPDLAPAVVVAEAQTLLEILHRGFAN